jgi:hypothetical protein
MVLIYQRVRDFLLNKKEPLAWLSLLVIILITLQQYLGGEKHFGDLPYAYTHYNNYLIFKDSFFHLMNGSDLYVSFPSEHWDLYKYSPTFALGMSLFAWMPDWLGLFLWNGLNAFCLWAAIRFLPSFDNREKNLLYLILFVEMITSVQNSQSNGLIAGLIIIAFALMERKYFFWACLCIAATVYVKLFGLFAFAICLLYPQRWKMVLYSAFWMAVLWVLPLAVVSWPRMAEMYASWYRLLQADYISNPLSMVGGMRAWFGLSVNSSLVLLLGLVLFAVPLLRWKLFVEARYRFLFLAMMLVWMVIFNHKAESPTFIIAMAGVAIAYITLANESKAVKWFTWFAVIFTSLSTTDIFPQVIQRQLFIPYSIKVLPCVIFYFFVLYQLIRYSAHESMRFPGPGRSDQ